MTRISAVINTFNEAHLLPDCIASLRQHVDEIVVCDMTSSDGSEQLARSLGCIVFTAQPMPYGEYTLVDRIKMAKGEWILSFDPDMRLPERTGRRLRTVVEQDEADVVQFYLATRVFGKFVSHGHGSAGYYTKFFKKELFLRNGTPTVEIHNMLNATLGTTTCRWLRLSREFPLIHLAYDSVRKCMEQHYRYAFLEASQRFERGERFSWRNLFVETTRKFLVDFVYRSAWKDGAPAIIYSAIAELMTLQIHLLLWEATQQEGKAAGKSRNRNEVIQS